MALSILISRTHFKYTCTRIFQLRSFQHGFHKKTYVRVFSNTRRTETPSRHLFFRIAPDADSGGPFRIQHVYAHTYRWPAVRVAKHTHRRIYYYIIIIFYCIF